MLRLAPDGRIYTWEEFSSYYQRGYAEQYWDQARGLNSHEDAAWSWPRTPVERDDDEEEDADFPIQGELLSHWQRG